MTAHSIKTDNANLAHKVQLRQEAARHVGGGLRVLDLFAGNNAIWKHFETERYYGVEKEKGKGWNLFADNVKIIPSLDLSGFNLIDCDSYGIPTDQICALYKNRTLTPGTVIVYTCIGNSMSRLNKQMRTELGIERMYRKSETMFNRRSGEYFLAMLANRGVRTVWEHEEKSATFRKRYGFFIV